MTIDDVTHSFQNVTSISDHFPFLQMLLSQAINGDSTFLLTQKLAKKGVLFRVDSSGLLWSLLNFVVASMVPYQKAIRQIF
ncbi:MAG: hypothetical protein JNM36_09870 [Chitinophagales bacterium]|nr:hypothetical protein [Chitinophagales bacterium]